MIKTAVIGASGYIGRHLLRKYRETFPDCIGTGFSRAGQGLIPFDLRHPDINRLELQKTGHETVIIASAMPNVGWCESHPKESYELNVKGTLQLIKQLDLHSLTTLFLSSDYVFNGETGNYSDQEKTSPITEYGRQKAEVEREIPNLTEKYAILRLSKIYGTTWKDGTLLDSLACDLMQNKKITVSTDQFFSPTHINDVVSMVLFVQEQGVKGLVNLCNTDPYSRYQIALKLAKALPVSSSLLEAVPLHSIPSMENRPLNTSLKCSSFLEKMQPSLLSIESAVKCVASNWEKCYAEIN